MKKVYSDAKAALSGLLKDGMLICAGGFGLCGIPEVLIKAIRDSGVKNLTIVSNKRQFMSSADERLSERPTCKTGDRKVFIVI